jgi:hypothetical protein
MCARGVGLPVISIWTVQRLPALRLIGRVEIFEADVGGEPVEPDPRGRRGRDAIQVAPATQKTLAHGFVGMMRASEHQLAIALKPGAMV